MAFRLLCLSLLVIASCSKPLANARVLPRVDYQSRAFEADPNKVYYAVRDSLIQSGYGVASEKLDEGSIATTWVSTTSDSHYIEVFGRRDYGINGAYHQLDIQLSRDDGRTTVRIGSKMKSLVSTLRSSGKEERKILKLVADRLRTKEPEITNLGMEE